MSAQSPGAGRLADQPHQQVDRPARYWARPATAIRSANWTSFAFCSGSNPVVPMTRVSGSGASLCDGQACEWVRERDHDIHRSRQRRFERDAQRREANPRPDVGAQTRMPRPDDRRTEAEGGIFLDQLDQPGSHPARGPMDADRERLCGQGESPLPGDTCIAAFRCATPHQPGWEDNTRLGRRSRDERSGSTASSDRDRQVKDIIDGHLIGRFEPIPGPESFASWHNSFAEVCENHFSDRFRARSQIRTDRSCEPVTTRRPSAETARATLGQYRGRAGGPAD